MNADRTLDDYYGNLRNYVRMVTQDYSNLLMLDAAGGLGKTHNVLDVLETELEADQFVHQKGFTTPIELYKTLYKARENDMVLFLDDVSGITSNTKAIDMLKSATDTEGVENWVEYRTSKAIDHPTVPGGELSNTFCFRGNIIMSFNETPSNHHFNALKDRGTFYQLQFSYDERVEIIKQIAEKPTFSELSVSEQRATARWLETATNPSYEVSIRTFEEVCNMRAFSQQSSGASSQASPDWEKMALDVFNMDYEKHLIIKMREAGEMPVADQVSEFCEETGKSESYYYDLLSELKSERWA